jgi:uncharacterized protein (DUF983 family)
MLAGTGLRGTLKEVARRATTVARLQAELAKAELASTGKNAGAGAALAAAAAFVGVFVFALFTALLVVALAIALPVWLSILIVLVVYLIVAAVLGAIARSLFRRAKGAPLTSEQARLTASALRPGRDGEANRPSESSSGIIGSAPTPGDRAQGDARG